MKRLALILPLAAIACTTPALPRSAQSDVRPVVAADDLRGRWAIVAVNGRSARGWLELGGEGQAKIIETGNAVFVDSLQPPTRAFLGCNDWYPSGWTRNGDKLMLGVAMSHRTERGCDPSTMALDNQAYAILHESVTMEITPPDRLRLINEHGTLDLLRQPGLPLPIR